MPLDSPGLLASDSPVYGVDHAHAHAPGEPVPITIAHALAPPSGPSTPSPASSQASTESSASDAPPVLHMRLPRRLTKTCAGSGPAPPVLAADADAVPQQQDAGPGSDFA